VCVAIQRSAAGRSGIAYGENSLSLKHSPLRGAATSCGPTILPLNNYKLAKNVSAVISRCSG
jgi:hypothetical protein